MGEGIITSLGGMVVSSLVASSNFVPYLPIGGELGFSLGRMAGSSLVTSPTFVPYPDMTIFRRWYLCQAMEVLRKYSLLCWKRRLLLEFYTYLLKTWKGCAFSCKTLCCINMVCTLNGRFKWLATGWNSYLQVWIF